MNVLRFSKFKTFFLLKFSLVLYITSFIFSIGIRSLDYGIIIKCMGGNIFFYLLRKKQFLEYFQAPPFREYEISYK